MDEIDMDEVVESTDQFDSPELRALSFGYPPALAKACGDPYSYALRLQTGDLITFERATPIDRTWVEINCGPTGAFSLSFNDKVVEEPLGGPLNIEHGIEVRVASIVWVIDGAFD